MEPLLTALVLVLLTTLLIRWRQAEPAQPRKPRDPREILAEYLPEARQRFSAQAFAQRLAEAAAEEIGEEMAAVRADAAIAAEEICCLSSIPGALWDAVRDVRKKGTPHADRRMRETLRRHLRLDSRMRALSRRLPDRLNAEIAGEAELRHQDFLEAMQDGGIEAAELQLAGLPLVAGETQSMAERAAPGVQRAAVGTCAMAGMAGFAGGAAMALAPAAIPEPVTAAAGLAIGVAVLAIGQHASRGKLLAAITSNLDHLEQRLNAEQRRSAMTVAQRFDRLWEKDLRAATRRVAAAMQIPAHLAA